MIFSEEMFRGVSGRGGFAWVCVLRLNVVRGKDTRGRFL